MLRIADTLEKGRWFIALEGDLASAENYDGFTVNGNQALIL